MLLHLPGGALVVGLFRSDYCHFHRVYHVRVYGLRSASAPRTNMGSFGTGKMVATGVGAGGGKKNVSNQ